MISISKADGFHLDVMDGVFVPNISFGFPVIEAVHKYGRKSIDTHHIPAGCQVIVTKIQPLESKDV